MTKATVTVGSRRCSHNAPSPAASVPVMAGTASISLDKQVRFTPTDVAADPNGWDDDVIIDTFGDDVLKGGPGHEK